MNTARNLTFLDETRELISIYDHAAEPETSYAATTSWNDNSSVQSAPSAARSQLRGNSPAVYDHANFEGLSSPVKRRRLTFSDSYHGTPAIASPGYLHHSPGQSWHSASPHTGWTPGDVSSIGNDAVMEAAFASLEPAPSLGQHSFTAVSESLSRIYLDAAAWPLSNRQEAQLLRYFVEQLARNFDLTDPLKHFRTVVPQRAATCPPLLNAIFALSARHLSRVSDFDPLISNRYHQECLKHLIPMLDDTTAILDENLLASTIILRHLEEIEIPLTGQAHHDQSSHLFGSHAFIAAQEHATVSGGLRQAAFWTGLRQEIYVAFVNQRSIIPALEHCSIDRSLEAAPDDVWACRMIVLCVDVIRFCFGEGDQSHALYNYLCESVAQWHQCKPGSFTPIYARDADLDTGPAFPELWFVGDEILTGLHHYHLARILLSAHDPRMPRLGPRRAAALSEMDESIRGHVRQMCGICLSNPSMGPNFTYASMGVTMAGEKFADRREQEALLGLLDMCDRLHGWPTGSVQTNLKVAWGWD